MTDIYDRATDVEQNQRDDALQAQSRRAGLTGKTISDSAIECHVCDEPIPKARRAAYPGCKTCVSCQTELEHGLHAPRHSGAGRNPVN